MSHWPCEARVRVSVRASSLPLLAPSSLACARARPSLADLQRVHDCTDPPTCTFTHAHSRMHNRLCPSCPPVRGVRTCAQEQDCCTLLVETSSSRGIRSGLVSLHTGIYIYAHTHITHTYTHTRARTRVCMCVCAHATRVTVSWQCCAQTNVY